MNPEDAALDEFLEKNADFRRTLRQDIMPAAMKSMYWARRMGRLGNLSYKLLNARPQFDYVAPEMGETPRMNPYFSPWV